jgi:NAD-dependent SIR2 family protein deacetylase
MKISFLLGAGVSQDLLSVRTDQLLDRMLTGRGVHKRQMMDGFYCVGAALNAGGDEKSAEIACFVRLVKAQLDAWFHDRDWLSGIRHEASYEDLFYVVWQINRLFDRQTINPALIPAADAIRAAFRAHKPQADFKETCEVAERYMIDILSSLLADRSSTPEQRETQFALVNEVYQRRQLHAVFTLNYDILLERFFDDRKIPFQDGFGDPSRETPREGPFNGDFLASNEPDKAPLLKLHGSLNWYRTVEKRVVKYTGANGDDKATWNFERCLPPRTPMILAGTHNKTTAYYSKVFVPLHHAFCQLLADTDVLIVAGCSLSDEGVDLMLRECSQDQPTTKIVIINPQEQQEFEARLRGNQFYQHWLQNLPEDGRRYRYIPRKFSDTHWADLEPFLSAGNAAFR